MRTVSSLSWRGLGHMSEQPPACNWLALGTASLGGERISEKDTPRIAVRKGENPDLVVIIDKLDEHMASTIASVVASKPHMGKKRLPKK